MPALYFQVFPDREDTAVRFDSEGDCYRLGDELITTRHEMIQKAEKA